MGVSSVDVKPTTATIVVNYIKSFPCLGPAQPWAERGKGKTETGCRASDRVGAGALSDSCQRQRFEISGLTLNTIYSVRGVMDYGLNSSRTNTPANPI